MEALKNIFISVVMLFLSTTAYSATYDIGTLGTAPYVQNVTVASGSFTDFFDFDIATDSTGASSISNHVLTFFGNNIFDISGLTLEVYQGASLLLGSYENMDLSIGSYTAKVFGSGTGVSGGNYTFSIITSPVPEASTLSLMMAGFGLIGFMSYRRRNMI